MLKSVDCADPVCGLNGAGLVMLTRPSDLMVNASMRIDGLAGLSECIQAVSTALKLLWFCKVLWL
jgi:hypothetical protein